MGRNDCLAGAAVIPFLIIQGIYGFSLLEVVNYVEHYGLKRQKLPNGRYERCSPRHSWNSNRIVTNIFLFQLQRHPITMPTPRVVISRCVTLMNHRNFRMATPA